MGKHLSERKDNISGKLRNNRGMTMAEVLIVIAILGVLAAVAFISVQAYQRSMGQLERDSIAKEIFIAAQNHLTMAKGEGYPGLDDIDTDFGEHDTAESEQDVYYYIVNKGKDVTLGTNADIDSGNTALNQMLPFGSVDETVRRGGSYIIRYQKNAGLVLDVFYCSTSGNPQKFNYELKVSDYATVKALKGEDKKDARKNWNDHIVGWYGGAAAAELARIELDAPKIEVINAERLYVKVWDTNVGKTDGDGNTIVRNTDYALRLIITGKSSPTVSHYLDLPDDRLSSTGDYFEIELDNITTDGKHFVEKRFDDMDDLDATNGFQPGEEVEIRAVAFSTSKLSNVAYSIIKTANSLFANGSTVNKALISNFRHLENLDMAISAVYGKQFGIANSKDVQISSADQTTDLNWLTADSGYWQDAVIRKSNITAQISLSATGDDPASKGKFVPVCLDYEMAYNGKKHSISNVTVALASGKPNLSDTGDAGLFGYMGSASFSESSIQDLALIDFNITGTSSAGALAGSLTNTSVTNVIARNSAGKDNKSTATVNATAGPAGGLIGSVLDCDVEYSGAALVVNGSGSTGGLIGAALGDASKASSVDSCYAGGHTEQGEYYTHQTVSGKTVKTPLYNVTASDAAAAGGLIGDAGYSAIENSYSTCSVTNASTTGAKAGGFIGTYSSGATITGCYCTGLVGGTGDNAFTGGGTDDNAFTGMNYYYEVVGEIPLLDDKDQNIGYSYKKSGAPSTVTKVKALDADIDTFNSFVGAATTWSPASAYDKDLVKYYDGKYNLKTVLQLPAASSKAAVADSNEHKNDYVATHYGDWPSPEVFFLNTPAGS